ncbi:MAG TPA: hypothetical protein VIU64_18565 [Polyangia bacterium]
MGKTSEVRDARDVRDVRDVGSPRAGAETQAVSDSGPSDGTKIRTRPNHQSEAQKAGKRRGERGQGEDDGIPPAEHLQQDFAKVRAKVAIDPVLASRSFSAAWTTDVMEDEDEAEFVDAVADCLGAGFSLESALTGWDNGTLAADGSEEASLFDESDRDDEATPSFPPRHTPTGGRRIVIS